VQDVKSLANQTYTNLTYTILMFDVVGWKQQFSFAFVLAVVDDPSLLLFLLPSLLFLIFFFHYLEMYQQCHSMLSLARVLHRGQIKRRLISRGDGRSKYSWKASFMLYPFNPFDRNCLLLPISSSQSKIILILSIRRLLSSFGSMFVVLVVNLCSLQGSS
jgi:hypothetical protein